MRWLILIFAVMLAGCAGNVPLNIRSEPAGNPALQAVSQDAKPYLGRAVRWGGSIISVDNNPNETLLEVLAQELDAFGRPIESDTSPGRFLAEVKGFLDPQIYRKDREVTVYGSVAPSVVRKVGEKPYTYPVVKAAEVYLWADYSPYRDPWRRDPFCDPFFGPGPYYRPWMWPYYDPFWGAYPPYCRW